MEHSNFCKFAVNIYFLLGFSLIVNCQFFIDAEVDIWLDELSRRAAEEYAVAKRSIPRRFSYKEEVRMRGSLENVIRSIKRIKFVVDKHLINFSGDKTTLLCVRKNIQKTITILEKRLLTQQQKRTTADWADTLSATLDIIGNEMIFQGLKHIQGDVRTAMTEIYYALNDVALATVGAVISAKQTRRVRMNRSNRRVGSKRNNYILCYQE